MTQTAAEIIKFLSTLPADEPVYAEIVTVKDVREILCDNEPEIFDGQTTPSFEAINHAFRHEYKSMEYRISALASICADARSTHLQDLS
jgi:hypothetical protein